MVEGVDGFGRRQPLSLLNPLSLCLGEWEPSPSLSSSFFSPRIRESATCKTSTDDRERTTDVALEETLDTPRASVLRKRYRSILSNIRQLRWMHLDERREIELCFYILAELFYPPITPPFSANFFFLSIL